MTDPTPAVPPPSESDKKAAYDLLLRIVQKCVDAGMDPRTELPAGFVLAFVDELARLRAPVAPAKCPACGDRGFWYSPDTGEHVSCGCKNKAPVAPAEALKRIEGCQHTPERMAEWSKEGACPICLTATCGMLRDEVARLKAESAMLIGESTATADDLLKATKLILDCRAEARAKDAALQPSAPRACRAQCNALAPGDPSMCDASGEACVCLQEDLLRTALAAARQREQALREALEGVVRVADRKTVEFDAARAALALAGPAAGE